MPDCAPACLLQLGGGDAEHRQLGEILRALVRHCGSTVLALTVHRYRAATAVRPCVVILCAAWDAA